MENNPLPEYSAELPLGYISRTQFFNAALKAVQNLHWQVASAYDFTIMCHTPGNDPSFGESVTITVGEEVCTFHSRSVNEYYFHEDHNAINAARFKAALDAVIENNKKIERNLRPIDRSHLGALVPSRTYIVTPILIYLNVLVFIVMVCCGVSPLAPTTESLVDWGGNIRTLTMHGQWWRLFTCMFLHGGIFHLLMNAYGLLYIGMFLEPLLGKFRTAAAYLLTGICASLLSVTMHPGTVSVGASGAIFGLYGVFASLLTTNHIEKTARNTMLRSILFFIMLNLLNGMKSGIDNAAHVGGLISGIIIGYCYFPGVNAGATLKKQLGVTAILAGAVTILSAFTLLNLRDDYAIYDKGMTSFFNQESMALEVYSMNTDTPKEKILYGLKERGIYYWKENIALLDSLDKLDLPETIRKKDKKLKEYCNLRIDVYEQMYNDVEATGTINPGNIEQRSKQIELLMNEIKNM